MIAVLIIDMQNAFFEDPVLSNFSESPTVACNEITAAAQERATKVQLVKSEHEEDKSTWTLNMLEDDQGFIFRDTAQAQFVSGLSVQGLPQMVKTRNSAFLGADLLLRLRNWNVDTIVLAGVSTHNCIAQTAADALGHNLRVIYAAEAMASENPEAAAAVQDILCREYRQQILPIAEIINRLMTPPKGQEVLS